MLDTMILSFKDKETAALFAGIVVRRLPMAMQRMAMRKLVMLDNAVHVDDLRQPPGNCLKKLAGNRQGQWSIRINDQWRICFVWCDGDAEHVEIADCH